MTPMRLRKPAKRPLVAVVEDDPAVGSMLKKILALDGFDVVLVSEGHTAFEKLRRSGCKAAVLDVCLPGKDGIQIVSQLRATADTHALPVIMLTGQTDDQTTWEGWKAGVNYFMTKPFDPQQLVQVLHQMIRTRRETRET